MQDVSLPLSFSQLKTEAIEHELVLICKDLWRLCLFRCEFYEIVESIKWYVLINRTGYNQNLN